MLRTLHINNYVLIDQLDLALSDGFSVITGETGAGKSILLGALGLLTGRRADTKAIRAGAKKCIVEATFDVSRLHLSDFFATNDIDFDGAECIVRREITATGKSRAFVNDSPVALGILREFTNHLIDIHSQHQNLLVGNERFLLDILDGYAPDASLPERYLALYKAWREAEKALATLRDEASRNAEEADYLRFQLAQIDEAHLTDGEQEELEQEQEQLSHSEDIKSALFHVARHITDEQTDLLGALQSDAHLLDGIAAVFPAANSLQERIESVRIELEDIAAEAEQAGERLYFNPARLEQVEERLRLIYDLLKKHHKECIADLLTLADDFRERLSRVDNAEELIAAKEQEVSTKLAALKKAAEALTAARQRAAKEIEKEMQTRIAKLGMPHAVLRFEMTQRQYDATGQDEVRLLFSAHQDLPPRDVSTTASGGEIARLMLSLKATVSQHQALPTIVFDEIDTGVSGRMADAMAEVMREMAQQCQVICITHLPQIAALGANHYKVYKDDSTATTNSHIVVLTPKERLHELATMLSGKDVTEAALGNARELLMAAGNTI